MFFQYSFKFLYNIFNMTFVPHFNAIVFRFVLAVRGAAAWAASDDQKQVISVAFFRITEVDPALKMRADLFKCASSFITWVAASAELYSTNHSNSPEEYRDGSFWNRPISLVRVPYLIPAITFASSFFASMLPCLAIMIL